MATVTGSATNLSALSALQKKMQLDWTEVAEIIGVDQSTLYRWRHGESTPRPMAWSRIAQLDDLLQILPRIFAGPDLARTWLRTAKPEMLGGTVTPLEVMKAGRMDRVLTVLHLLGRGG